VSTVTGAWSPSWTERARDDHPPSHAPAHLSAQR
jgi:hypothetical protein